MVSSRERPLQNIQVALARRPEPEKWRAFPFAPRFATAPIGAAGFELMLSWDSFILNLRIEGGTNRTLMLRVEVETPGLPFE
jgi:hypothetical protein